MGKKTLTDCKRQRDFVAYAEERGANVKTGGRHLKVQYDGYSIPIPNGEIKTGTKRAIIKAFCKIGLGLLVIATLVTVMI